MQIVKLKFVYKTLKEKRVSIGFVFLLLVDFNLFSFREYCDLCQYSIFLTFTINWLPVGLKH